MVEKIFSVVLLTGLAMLACEKAETEKPPAAMPAAPAEPRPAQALAPAGTGGVLRGRVVFEGQPPAPAKLLVVKDAAICGKIEHVDERLTVGKNGGIKNAVVYLADAPGGKSLAELGSEFILDQRVCTYQPHVLIAPVKTPIQVLNNDGILHNLHTFSAKNPPLNLAQPAFKKKMAIAFDIPEAIPVKCDVHGWMGAWIFVVDHPYYSVTDTRGASS
jgi:hypothetical protein